MSDRAKKCLLLLAGLTFGVLLAEVALRVAGIAYLQPYRPDAYCGTLLRAGYRGYFSQEGRAHFSVNSAGFRDREHSLAKADGTVRVALIGDSFVEALGVPWEQTLAAQLERELTSRRVFGDARVEVLSFGISGYGTAQELLLWRHYVQPYDPDVVLLAFFPGNDIIDNSAALAPYQVRPFFHLEDGQLVLDNAFRDHPDFRKARSRLTRIKVAVIDWSRIVQLVLRVRSAGRHQPPADPDGGTTLDDVAFVEPTDEDTRDAWTLTERLIGQLHQEATAEGADFQLLIVSQPIQVHPDQELRNRAARRLGVADLCYGNRRLARLAQRAGFPVIDLAAPMQRAADEKQVYLHGFDSARLGVGHWNAAGHELAAEIVANALESSRPAVDRPGPAAESNTKEDQAR